MLPGLDGLGKRFADFIRELGPRVDVVVIRYPPDERLGYAELEPRIRAALPTDERFVLLGESFSGPLALRIAARPPAGLAGLVLCSTFAKPPVRVPRWMIPLIARVPLKALPRWLRSIVQWGSLDPRRAPKAAERSMAGVDAAVVRHRLEESLRVDATPLLAGLALPVLIVAARGDVILSRRAARQIHRGVPGARLEELDGPHALLQSRPAECARTVLRFMQPWL